MGRVVVAYARDLQRCIDAAGSAVAGLHGLTSGRVRVGVLQTANMHLVPRALSQLAARHPGIHTSVRELSGLQIETGVAEGDLDLGIGFAPVVREGITVTRLYSESFVLVAHCEDGIKYRTSATLEDAIRKPLALLSGEYTTRRLVDLYCSEAGTTLRPVIETNTISSLLELVREGGFRTLLPYSALVGTHGRDLAYVPLAYPRVKRSVAILLREGAVTSPAATVVSALVREVAAALVHSHGSELAVND